jgi:hypothetical protein
VWQAKVCVPGQGVCGQARVCVAGPRCVWPAQGVRGLGCGIGWA